MEPTHGDVVLQVSLPPALERDGIATVECAGREIVLLKMANAYRAIDRRCPHEGGDLGEGSMVGQHMKCPVHGFIYNVATGKCLNQRGWHAQVYDVEVRDGSIILHPRERGGVVTRTAC